MSIGATECTIRGMRRLRLRQSSSLRRSARPPTVRVFLVHVVAADGDTAAVASRSLERYSEPIKLKAREIISDDYVELERLEQVGGIYAGTTTSQGFLEKVSSKPQADGKLRADMISLSGERFSLRLDPNEQVCVRRPDAD